MLRSRTPWRAAALLSLVLAGSASAEPAWRVRFVLIYDASSSPPIPPGGDRDGDGSEDPDHCHNRGLRFDGVDDSGLSGAVPGMAASWTLEGWVRPDVLRRQGILAITGGGVDAQLGMQDDGRIRARGVPGDIGDLVSTGAVPAAAWSHLALAYDSSTSTLELFVDGVSAGSAAGAAAPTDGSRVALAPLDVDRLEGVLDDVRLWAYARSAQEIEAQRRIPLYGDEPGLIAYWLLDEASGQSAANEVAGAPRIALAGSPDWTYDGSPPTEPASWNDSAWSCGEEIQEKVAYTNDLLARFGRGYRFDAEVVHLVDPPPLSCEAGTPDPPDSCTQASDCTDDPDCSGGECSCLSQDFGVSQWTYLPGDNPAENAIWAFAQVDPAPWLYDAGRINVYLFDNEEGGYSDNYSVGDLDNHPVVVGQSRKGVWSRLLHEVGHYLGLLHTHGYNDQPDDPDQVCDTLQDQDYWGRLYQVADHNFVFADGVSDLTCSEQRQVWDVSYNIMSYHADNNRLDDCRLSDPATLSCEDGSTRICSLSGKGCKSDSECTSGPQTCMITPDTCAYSGIPCGNDNHCSANEPCDSPPDRCSGTGTVCTTDPDCPPGESCVATAGSCRVSGKTCFVDTECTEPEVCNVVRDYCSTSLDTCFSDNDCEADLCVDSPMRVCSESEKPCVIGAAPGTTLACSGGSDVCVSRCRKGMTPDQLDKIAWRLNNLALAGVVSELTLFVDPLGAAPCDFDDSVETDCSCEHAPTDRIFSSVASALTASQSPASPNPELIVLRGGSYAETPTIDHAVTLRASRGDAVIGN